MQTPIPSAPGPEPLPIVGGIGNVMRYIRDPIKNASRLFHHYGNVVSLVRAPIHIASPGPGWGGRAPGEAIGAGVVLVNGADNNREVLTQHDRYHMIALPGRLVPTFGEVSERQRPMLRMMTGLFDVNGNEHRRHRRLLMPAFHKTRIEGYRDDMARITEETLARYRNGEVRDIHADMTELTLRVATKTLFGEDEGERGVGLARMMQSWLLTMFNPLMMLARYDLPGTPYRRFLDLTREIDKQTAAIVHDKRRRGSLESSQDMLSTLLAARDEDGSALDEDELIGHAGVIFAAGHETSTNALAWTLFLLSQHPSITRDLEDELDAVLRGAAPSIEALAKLPLLDAVVKESMRVLPPVPMHPRIVAEDHELAGHRLPAGSELFLSIFHMHHDPAVFPHPERFEPRRWETCKPSVYEYNPFSAGPRMCIGASFASMEIKIVLATMLQRHRFELPASAQVDPRVAITMAPVGGLPMRVRRRTEATRPSSVRGKIRDLVSLPS
ncbi:MAG: cytochrome P450 [Polyangiales bacterium]